MATKSHVAMVLGDQAYDRGAWANRIGESEPGVGYVWGEGIREPLRIRGGWVPERTIKALMFRQLNRRRLDLEGEGMNTRPMAAVEALWTPADVAEYLQIAEKTLTDWRHRRIGPPFVRLGKHVRYDPAAVRAWLAAQQTPSDAA